MVKHVGVRNACVFYVRYTNHQNYKIILRKKPNVNKDSGLVFSSILGDNYDSCLGNLGLKLRYQSGLVFRGRELENAVLRIVSDINVSK